MDRRDRPVVTLFADGAELGQAGTVFLTGDPVQHARARRVREGDPVRLIDGLGQAATGRVDVIGKQDITIEIDRVTTIARPEPLEVMVPVADRDRMLFAAEKCVELQVTSWRPVYFARSRSVTPRGEGAKFGEKVRARMRSALEQSGGAWMPSIHEEAEALDALRSASTEARRLLLDRDGAPLPGLAGSVPTVIAVGPEGGLEPHELAVAAESGWTLASVGTATLRFETAVMAAAAVIRAMQLKLRSS